MEHPVQIPPCWCNQKVGTKKQPNQHSIKFPCRKTLLMQKNIVCELQRKCCGVLANKFFLTNVQFAFVRLSRHERGVNLNFDAHLHRVWKSLKSLIFIVWELQLFLHVNFGNKIENSFWPIWMWNKWDIYCIFNPPWILNIGSGQ